jgi:hypothetical protein
MRFSTGGLEHKLLVNPHVALSEQRLERNDETSKNYLELRNEAVILPSLRLHFRQFRHEGSAPGEDTVQLIRKPFKMTLKLERSGSRFFMDNADDGKAVIRLELFHDTAPVLNGLHIGFELLSGTTREQATKLVEAMNERIIGVIATPNH